MIWSVLALASSLFLGLYDVVKKFSLRDNAVIPVLFFATLVSSLLFLPVFLVNLKAPLMIGDAAVQLLHRPLNEHLHYFIKSVLVGTSWIFAYFALRHLPITIVTPIRSTGPMWTLVGALLIFNEQLNLWQWVGLVITLFFFYRFTFAGQKEGISFRRNKWILFIIVATILGAASSLFDKYLIQRFDRIVMQAWFSVYLVVYLFPVMMLTWYPRRKRFPFNWRWSIVLIGVFLTTADFVYFLALSKPDALIAVISAIRRSSVLFSFSIGAVLFREKNILHKGMILLGILIGVLVMIVGS